MFLRMLFGALTRQWKKMLMIAFTIALGASLAMAMLSVMMDVGDKVNQELKAYGANITVVPKESAVLTDLYDVKDSDAAGSYLLEEELGKIKTIFWAFNIVDYTPLVNAGVTLPDGSEARLTGTWFNHHMELPTGETLDAGIKDLRTWWEIVEGDWIDEQKTGTGKEPCMVGSGLAAAKNLHAGDILRVKGTEGEKDLLITGIFDAGDEEDQEIFTSLRTAQDLSGLDGLVDSIEVSALTTPDNELAEKAAKDPGSLSVDQYETWYCTAYVSSICYQIQEVITDSVASAVRQVADSEGEILNKTQLLMILITILSLIGAALGICNLVTASVMERAQEIGLMKAIGAQNFSVTALVLSEIMVTAVCGGIVGFFAGFGFAQIIGITVFGDTVTLRPMVIPIVAVLVLVVTLIGSIPAVKLLTGLRPTEVLHQS